MPIATCDDRAEYGPEESFMLAPVFAADVSPSNPKATYEGRCFEEITFEYEKVVSLACFSDIPLLPGPHLN